MSIAIISDIHANLDALDAVMADIEQRDVKRIVCLGDIVGYGPNPCECLERVMDQCEFALMGNHDFAVLYEPTNFNASAVQACFWTRKQIETVGQAKIRRARWEYLGGLMIRYKFEEALWFHASPRRPINEYIFPDDVVTSPVKMQQIFDRIDQRCFVGHTHVPGVFTSEPDFYPPADFDHHVYKFVENEKCVINPGSVGQPRDRDPRAAYAILREDAVEFVRVEYDVQTVIDKVKKIDALSDWLGQRLREGR